jgi:hypothetical protein
VTEQSTRTIAVTVWALWRGAEVAGDGTFELRMDGLRIAVPATGVDIAMPFTALDGARTAAAHLTLYPANGDVLELSGHPALEDAGRHLRARACTLPELTLALRGLGSARANPGPDHDRFFGPLLTARRAAQRASDPAGRLAAMRGSAIAAELGGVLRGFAAERYPASPPDRRALDAALDDLAAPVWASLSRLDEVAHAAADARDDTAFVWWRAWATECRALFAHADRCWLQAMPVLAETRAPARTFWQWPWRRAQAPVSVGATDQRRA